MYIEVHTKLLIGQAIKYRKKTDLKWKMLAETQTKRHTAKLVHKLVLLELPAEPEFFRVCN